MVLIILSITSKVTPVGTDIPINADNLSGVVKAYDFTSTLGLGEALIDLLGLIDPEGLTLPLGDIERLILLLGEILPLGETLADLLPLGDMLLLGDIDLEIDALAILS